MSATGSDRAVAVTSLALKRDTIQKMPPLQGGKSGDVLGAGVSRLAGLAADEIVAPVMLAVFVDVSVEDGRFTSSELVKNEYAVS